MRTKTFLIAAAALAAGLATSLAQSNVYSVNIVGWVNVPLAANTQYLLNNPLDTGANYVTNIGAGWSNGSAVQTWNGTGFNLAQKSALGWTASPLLNPGTGFFIKGSKAQTLTFIGSAPTSNNYVLANKVQVLVGAVIPTAGSNTDSGANSLNMAGFANGTAVQTWNGTGFNLAQKSALGWTGTNAIPVAGGFFIKPGGATGGSGTWTQYLQ